MISINAGVKYTQKTYNISQNKQGSILQKKFHTLTILPSSILLSQFNAKSREDTFVTSSQILDPRKD